jgi:hypothetical protein
MALGMGQTVTYTPCIFPGPRYSQPIKRSGPTIPSLLSEPERGMPPITVIAQLTPPPLASRGLRTMTEP